MATLREDAMTRFVLDAGALIHVVSADIPVSESHELLAPTLIRSQTLSALLDEDLAARAGTIVRVASIDDLVRP
jgi:hypothetical protein